MLTNFGLEHLRLAHRPLGRLGRDVRLSVEYSIKLWTVLTGSRGGPVVGLCEHGSGQAICCQSDKLFSGKPLTWCYVILRDHGVRHATAVILPPTGCSTV